MTLSLVSLLAASSVLASPGLTPASTAPQAQSEAQEALEIARLAAQRADEAARAAQTAADAARTAAAAAHEARQAALMLGVAPAALPTGQAPVVLATGSAVPSAAGVQTAQAPAPVVLPQAAPEASVLTASLPQSMSFALKGYGRTSFGAGSEGGDQACFGLPGVSKYRFGNECDTYVELTPSLTFPVSKTGVTGAYTLTGYYYNPQPMMSGGAESGSFGISQNYLAFTGFGGWLDGATIWGGRRLYQRHDLHVNDLFYWSNRGQGAGIEHIDTPLGKLSLALMRNYNSTGPSIGNETNGVAGNSIDVRLSQIQTNRDGALELGVELRTADTVGEAKAKDGFLLTAEHVQQNLWGGKNTFVLQYGKGAGANLSTNDPGAFLYTTDDTRALRVIDQFQWSPREDVSASFNILYEKTEDFRFNGRVLDEREWFSVGTRPVWAWSENISSMIDVGYDVVRYGNDPMGNLSGREARMTKVTVAPLVFKLGRGFYDRPELRLFGTCARWNGDANVVALESGLAGGNVTNNSNYAGRRDGCSAGVQLETWF